MQNHIQYPNNFNFPQPLNSTNQAKFPAQGHLKGFDKTLPNMNVKHYASNPNLSLDVNGMKTSAVTN